MIAASGTPHTPQANPLAQAKYQVRFDWGLAGAERIAADADVIVLVDVLAPERALTLSDGSNANANANADTPAPDAAALAARAELLASLAPLAPSAPILSAGLTDAAAVARWIVELQHRIRRRTMIAVVAAGGEENAPGAGIRFAVENQLAAGAVIDELAALGIDYSSPEAAAACASFTALRGAVGHLLTASASAQQLLAIGGDSARIRAAGTLNSADEATVLRASEPETRRLQER